jgi:hypothetical protein
MKLNRKHHPTRITAGLLAALSGPVVADEFIDARPLLRNVVAASPGAETIIPYMVLRDTNADGNPDIFYIEYRVYKGGTTTFLHKSKGKSASLPCAEQYYFDSRTKFLGEPGSPRIHTAAELFTFCYDVTTGDYKETFLTLVFSADVSVAENAGWSYLVARQTSAFDFVDLDDDGQSELSLSTLYPIDPDNPAAGENVVVRVMNATTGTGLSEIAYPLRRP